MAKYAIKGKAYNFLCKAVFYMALYLFYKQHHLIHFMRHGDASIHGSYFLS
jgi:hypothetical protein